MNRGWAPARVTRVHDVMWQRCTALVLAIAITGCYVPVTRIRATPLRLPMESMAADTTIAADIRVTLFDGRIIEYSGPVLLGPDGVSGRGHAVGDRRPIGFTPRDSIAFLASVRREVRPLPTIVATAATTFAVTVAAFFVFVNIGN